MKYPILYKRTSAGAVQIWYATVNGGEYTTSSGQLDGKITTKKPTICKGKNIGKANETTPEQQAVAEVQALYTKKLRQDYHETLESIDNADLNRFKPMLAHKWADEAEDVPDDVLIHVQPKLDGFRCVGKNGLLETRDGLPIPTCPHIIDGLNHIHRMHPDVVFDGELYNHDLADDFNKISSLIRKKKPTEADLMETSQKVQYHIYDLPSSGKENYSERHRQLQELLANLPPYYRQMIKSVETVRMIKGEVDVYFDQMRALGYEGAIVRLDAPYEHKRSKNLLKVKQFLDDEFIIVDIQEGKGNAVGLAKRVILRTDEGQEFGVGVIGNDQYAAELYDRRSEFIGQRGTVKFLRWTPAPRKVPYGGKFKEVRFG